MQAIKESFEHAKEAQSLMGTAVEKGHCGADDVAYIEAQLAISKAISGLALAVLATQATHFVCGCGKVFEIWINGENKPVDDWCGDCIPI